MIQDAFSTRRDVTILGAGLAGRLLAWRLARDGVRVRLLERGDAGGSGAAAWVAAAMLAPLTESAVSEPLLALLGAAALERWPVWLAQLPVPVFFQRNGTLVLWHPSDRTEADAFSHRIRTNAPPALLADGIVPLDAAGIADKEPLLGGRFRQGWWMRDEGQLDNRMLLDALGHGLDAAGVVIETGMTVDTDEPGSWPEAGVVVDCRGLGARRDWRGLRGIRGEVIRVLAPDVTLNRPVRLLHPRYPIYIAPKEQGRFVIGATEIESDDASPLSVRSALELLSAAYAVHPAFGEARILELNTQCRPTLPDHRPAIVVREQPGTTVPVVAINGLYRHGFMIAPEIVEEAHRFVLALLGDRGSQGSRPARRGGHREGGGAARTGSAFARVLACYAEQRDSSRWPALYPVCTFSEAAAISSDD